MTSVSTRPSCSRATSSSGGGRATPRRSRRTERFDVSEDVVGRADGAELQPPLVRGVSDGIDALLRQFDEVVVEVVRPQPDVAAVAGPFHDERSDVPPRRQPSSSIESAVYATASNGPAGAAVASASRSVAGPLSSTRTMPSAPPRRPRATRPAKPASTGGTTSGGASRDVAQPDGPPRRRHGFTGEESPHRRDHLGERGDGRVWACADLLHPVLDAVTDAAVTRPGARRAASRAPSR